jgi:hypothetical protein
MARYPRITANEIVVGQLGSSTFLALRQPPSGDPSNLSAGVRMHCLDGVATDA